MARTASAARLEGVIRKTEAQVDMYRAAAKSLFEDLMADVVGEREEALGLARGTPCGRIVGGG